jgi:hypothetical protein
MAKTVSGKVQKTPPGQVSADRYDFIELAETEPDLGVPSTAGAVLTSSVLGVRSWSQLSYVHAQAVANSTWFVPHNLGFYPNITVQDSGGSIVEGEVSYTNSNELTITFSAAFSGNAYLS